MVRVNGATQGKRPQHNDQWMPPVYEIINVGENYASLVRFDFDSCNRALRPRLRCSLSAIIRYYDLTVLFRVLFYIKVIPNLHRLRSGICTPNQEYQDQAYFSIYLFLQLE